MTRSLHGRPTSFDGGLVDVGRGTCAWLQPVGDWGESNAGLVVGDGASVLVDTAWDLPLTRRLLAATADRTADAPITTLVATHGDGDHVNGFALVPDAELVASDATRRDMEHERPGALRRSQLGARVLGTVGVGPPRRFGAYVTWMLGPFDFRGVRVRRPDRTFDLELTLEVGGRELRLTRLGPAHTSGDTIVHVPDERVVFAGDLLFVGVTPNAWSGTVSGWRRALDGIGTLGADAVVPGHGPVGGPAEVELLDRYWAWLEPRVLAGLDRGTSALDLAHEIVTDDAFHAEPWGAWSCPERTVMNVEIVRRGRAAVPRPISHRERPGVIWNVAQLAHRLRGGGV